jgi:hypothetical protein
MYCTVSITLLFGKVVGHRMSRGLHVLYVQQSKGWGYMVGGSGPCHYNKARKLGLTGALSAYAKEFNKF